MMTRRISTADFSIRAEGRFRGMRGNRLDARAMRPFMALGSFRRSWRERIRSGLSAPVDKARALQSMRVGA